MEQCCCCACRLLPALAPSWYLVNVVHHNSKTIAIRAFSLSKVLPYLPTTSLRPPSHFFPRGLGPGVGGLRSGSSPNRLPRQREVGDDPWRQAPRLPSQCPLTTSSADHTEGAIKRHRVDLLRATISDHPPRRERATNTDTILGSVTWDFLTRFSPGGPAFAPAAGMTIQDGSPTRCRSVIVLTTQTRPQRKKHFQLDHVAKIL